MYKEFSKKLGNNIRIKRESLKLSQEELADIANVSRAYIGMIERGERAVSLKKLFQVSRALNSDFNELFEFDDVKKYTYNETF